MGNRLRLGKLKNKYALLGTIIAHPVIRWLVLATLQLFAKLEVSSFIRSKYMQAVTKFKNSAHARLWVMCEIGLAKIYSFIQNFKSSINQ